VCRPAYASGSASPVSHRQTDHIHRGQVLRRFASFTFVCSFLLFASFAHAQHTDFAVGGSILWSPQNLSASGGFVPPPEKGGMYPAVSLEHLFTQHLGYYAEGAFRYHEGIYNDYQPYRAIFYDVNAVYTDRVAPKTHGDFMAGVGGQTLIFYTPGGCGVTGGGCQTHIDSTHFLMHLGVGVRYYFWKNWFVRPEAHYYFIPDNYQFHSDNVFRVGASIGYTWGPH
jgi:hypothetical protein